MTHCTDTLYFPGTALHNSLIYAATHAAKNQIHSLINYVDFIKEAGSSTNSVAFALMRKAQVFVPCDKCDLFMKDNTTGELSAIQVGDVVGYKSQFELSFWEVMCASMRKAQAFVACDKCDLFVKDNITGELSAIQVGDF